MCLMVKTIINKRLLTYLLLIDCISNPKGEFYKKTMYSVCNHVIFELPPIIVKDDLSGVFSFFTLQKACGTSIFIVMTHLFYDVTNDKKQVNRFFIHVRRLCYL